MPDNTPGFEFNENPASPNSEASAVNLNNLVKKAVIRNIAPAVVASTHLHPSVAGAGIGGANGSPLFVKTDDETLEVADDKLKVKDGGIRAAQIADGSISMDKLADAVKTAISTVIKGIYKVGDYFITHNDEDPAKRFGGTWELCKDIFLLGAGGDYELLSTGGEKEHTLAVEELPEHRHFVFSEAYENPRVLNKTSLACSDSGDNGRYNYALTTSDKEAHLGNSGKTGGGKAHNNMPPYKAVYIWVKISDEDSE